jgi:S1-C subfamily serine protease
MFLPLLFLVITAGVPTAPQAFAKAYARVEPSVVTVAARIRGGTRLGSGFVAGAQGQVVCASQTVERAVSVEILLGETWLPARVVALDKDLRVAVLQLDGADVPLLRPAAVARRAWMPTESWVVAVERSPDGKAHPIAGMVAQQLTGNPPVTLVDAPAAPGSPLVNVHGEVVGMSLGRINRTRGRATALEPLRAFLTRAAGAVNPTSTPRLPHSPPALP